jgi:hypothetical protein
MEENNEIPLPQLKIIKIEGLVPIEIKTENRTVWTDINKQEKAKNINFNEFESYFYEEIKEDEKEEGKTSSESEKIGKEKIKKINDLLKELQEDEIIFAIEQLPNYVLEIETNSQILFFINQVFLFLNFRSKNYPLNKY